MGMIDAEQLKQLYADLAHKEALFIRDTKDIEALSRIIKNQTRQLERLVQRREKTRKELNLLAGYLEAMGVN